MLCKHNNDPGQCYREDCPNWTVLHHPPPVRRRKRVPAVVEKERHAMKLSDLNILSIGHTIQMAGAVFTGEGKVFLCLFPGERGELESINCEPPELIQPRGAVTDRLRVHVLDMDLADWERFVRQTDELETEVLSKASDGKLAKIILRKSQRAIDGNVQWKVWKRDGYTCRYCGNNDCPLSVDHLVLWEEGGPSTVENLVTACKKCNKIRGNMSYADWLQHPRYRETSKKLSGDVVMANEALLGKLDKIPRMVHTRSR